MQNLIGIIPADDGTFVQVTLHREQKNWKIVHIKRREIQNSLENILLFNKGIHLGVESHWVHEKIPEYIELQSTGSYIGNFYVCTRTAHFNLFSDLLKSNLLGVFPEDAYLCTIPLFFAPSSSDSFVTLSKENDAFKLAIIIDRKLIVSFTIPVSSDPRQLKGFFARVRRYWRNLNTGRDFPDSLYLLRITDFASDEFKNIQKIPFEVEDISVLKAAGIALCGLGDAVPCFNGPTEESRFRFHRSLIYISSIILVSTIIALLIASGMLNLYYSYRIEKCKTEYNNLFDHNKEIRELFKKGEVLADKLSRIEAIGSEQSSWAKLLQFIGSQRPQGLYIEKLGSDPLQKSNSVRIALMGWSIKEIAVTEFLKNLTSCPFLTNVNMTTLERDEKNNNIFTFKIICQLKATK